MVQVKSCLQATQRTLLPCSRTLITRSSYKISELPVLVPLLPFYGIFLEPKLYHNDLTMPSPVEKVSRGPLYTQVLPIITMVTGGIQMQPMYLANGTLREVIFLMTMESGVPKMET